MHGQERWATLLLCLVILSSVLLSAAQKQNKATSPAHNPVKGAKIFRYYCAACHGADARGHGPASAALKHAVPDLTLISKRNGGTFSHQRVKEIIDGKEPGPLAHGDREMPIWGQSPNEGIEPRLGRSTVGRLGSRSMCVSPRVQDGRRCFR